MGAPVPPAETTRREVDVLVIGSGAGGAITAATLAEAGYGVLVVEEGPAVDPHTLRSNSPEAMRLTYRNAGLSPILGSGSIAFVEGCCVGGSTEINSAFWHRPPDAAIDQWAADYAVDGLSAEALAEDVAALEAELRPEACPPDALPPSSRVFARGLRAVGLPANETARLQSGDPARSQFAAGAKRSMSQTILPRAQRAGAEVLPGYRARRLHHRGGRVERATFVASDGTGRRLEVTARHVIVCCGAVQTPALLRANGIKHRVGETLKIQPMIKVVATFDEVLDAHESVMPVYQMRDPRSGLFLGGSVCTPGFLGMTLGERWPENEEALADWRSMAIFYAACRGTGEGSVRAFPVTGDAFPRYSLSADDARNLSRGVAQLCEILFASGARRIHPGVRDAAPLASAPETARLCGARGDALPVSRMAVSTVHVTSSCPMGEDEARCAVDSQGRVRGFSNLRVADASILPEAPGVNPQGTVMALARRNARLFVAENTPA